MHQKAKTHQLLAAIKQIEHALEVSRFVYTQYVQERVKSCDNEPAVCIACKRRDINVASEC